MDYISVINLGHSAKEPLMCLGSELVDGSEPHGTILLTGMTRARDTVRPGGCGCTQGGAGWVGTWEGYTGY